MHRPARRRASRPRRSGCTVGSATMPFCRSMTMSAVFGSMMVTVTVLAFVCRSERVARRSGFGQALDQRGGGHQGLLFGRVELRHRGQQPFPLGDVALSSRLDARRRSARTGLAGHRSDAAGARPIPACSRSASVVPIDCGFTNSARARSAVVIQPTLSSRASVVICDQVSSPGFASVRSRRTSCPIASESSVTAVSAGLGGSGMSFMPPR